MTDLHSEAVQYGPPLGDGRSSDVFADGPDRVVKLYRFPWEAAAIANEFDATALAWTLGLPVARPYGIVDLGSRRGIVFERLRGATMLRRHGLDPLGFLGALRRMAHLQRRIHACDAASLPPIAPTLRHQIAAARASDPVKRAALAAIDRLPGGASLCHGDLHPGNVVCTPSGLHAVDWQKAGAGHPAADAARSALLLRYGRLNLGRFAGSVATDAVRRSVTLVYLWHYTRLTGLSVSEIRAWCLPLLVSRLFGQVAPNEGEVRAETERLARGHGLA